MTAVHVCTGGPKTWIKLRRKCPLCGQGRRILGWAQEWYDTTWTCLACGDSWAGGELLPRPFCRGWRSEAIRKAEARWRELP